MIKINVVDKRYWYQPRIETSSRRKWVARPYTNLKKLLVTEKLIEENTVISFNGDKDHAILRQLLQLKGQPFTWKKMHDIEIEEKDNIQIKIAKRLYISFDKTSLKSLNKGFLPFYDVNSLRALVDRNRLKTTNVILTWRSKGFIEKTPKSFLEKINIFK